jgi:hypothetical protein
MYLSADNHVIIFQFLTQIQRGVTSIQRRAIAGAPTATSTGNNVRLQINFALFKTEVDVLLECLYSKVLTCSCKII